MPLGITTTRVGSTSNRRRMSWVLRETAMMASAISSAVFSIQHEIVTVAELVAFPGAQRFQRMDGDHHRDVVEDLGKDTR